MKTRFKPAIIVHGGAGAIKDSSLPQRLDGCKAAALAGWKVLQKRGSAIDAVEAAVVVLEDNPLFNAGTGSTLNSLGKIEMDAAIMSNDSLRAGAVAAVSGIKNPVKLARRIMEDGRHVMFVGEGALWFARQMGLAKCPAESPGIAGNKKRRESKHGTVGCVAYDSKGKLAVATSTGGIHNKLPGRVGDSPLIGCGTYTDDYGAASCTGNGEAIIRLVLGKTGVGYLEEGCEPHSAAKMAVSALEESFQSTGGIILIDRWGKIGYARNTSHMPVCFVTDGGDIGTDS
jgi:beta-aspartyl-peptidase (threonine type)